jgi:hypothetical protein
MEIYAKASEFSHYVSPCAGQVGKDPLPRCMRVLLFICQRTLLTNLLLCPVAATKPP